MAAYTSHDKVGGLLFFGNNGFQNIISSAYVLGAYIHIDAHHDLYGVNEEGKSRDIYHSNFLADLLQRCNVDQVRLMGCRDRRDPVLHLQEQGYDVDWIESAEGLGGPAMHTHLSIDIGVLGPNRFGGVSSPLANGWSLEQLFAAVRGVTLPRTVDILTALQPTSLVVAMWPRTVSEPA